MALAHKASRAVLDSNRLGPPRRFLATLSDERLAERLRRGNELAFEVLFERHHRPLLGFCRHLLRSHEEAEDALQQVFMSAHRALTEKGDRPARLKPWLYTIARNRCISMMRSHKEDVRPLEDQVDTAGGAPGEKAEERADLEALVADVRALPEGQRTALVMTELGGLSHAEVAAVLECEQSKVKSLVFQGRATLIEQRQAREAPCREVREEIATMAGSRLRGRARRHVKSCAPCSAFDDEVRRQRQLLAVALPVAPSLGLKRSVLAATTGVGGGGGASGGGLAAGAAIKAGGVGGAGGAGGVAASGGAAAGTGVVAAVTAHAGVTKAAAVALAAGSVATGVTVGDKQSETARSPAPKPSAERKMQATPAPAARAGGDRSGHPPTQEGSDVTRREAKNERKHGPPPASGSPPDHAASDEGQSSATRSPGPSSADAAGKRRANPPRDPSPSPSHQPGSQKQSNEPDRVRHPPERTDAPSGKPDRATVARPNVPDAVESTKDTATGKLDKALPAP